LLFFYLLIYTFLVVSLISLFAGNDVVILTTTPIILIFCRNARIDPKPFMYVSFFAANTFSMPLYIGNLTNIMIGDSYRLDYFGFTGFMVLPTLAAGIVNYYLLKHIFRRHIQVSFDANLSDNIMTATFVVSLISALMCNLVNNIPMTAMILSILQHPGLTPDMNTAMAYSLVIGSNLGANFTTFGALAGILWLESAKRYGWSTTMTDFLKIGLFVTPIAILASSIVLAVEILLF